MGKPEKRVSRRHETSFKRDAARLMMNRQGKSVAQIASDLGVSSSQLYAWQAEYGEAVTQPVEAMQAEIERLRKEVVVLREERDVLKKATLDSIGQCNFI